MQKKVEIYNYRYTLQARFCRTVLGILLLKALPHLANHSHLQKVR